MVLQGELGSLRIEGLGAKYDTGLTAAIGSCDKVDQAIERRKACDDQGMLRLL